MFRSFFISLLIVLSLSRTLIAQSTLDRCANVSITLCCFPGILVCSSEKSSNPSDARNATFCCERFVCLPESYFYPTISRNALGWASLIITFSYFVLLGGTIIAFVYRRCTRLFHKHKYSSNNNPKLDEHSPLLENETSEAQPRRVVIPWPSPTQFTTDWKTEDEIPVGLLQCLDSPKLTLKSERDLATAKTSYADLIKNSKFASGNLETRLRMMKEIGVPDMRVLPFSLLHHCRRIPKSDEGLTISALDAVTRHGLKDICFVSHRWTQTPDKKEKPDCENNIQALLIHSYFKNQKVKNIFIWIDYSSIDQMAANKEKKFYICALPLYVACCTSFVTIAPSSSLEGIEQRGWIQLERMMAFAYQENGILVDVVYERIIDQNKPPLTVTSHPCSWSECLCTCIGLALMLLLVILSIPLLFVAALVDAFGAFACLSVVGAWICPSYAQNALDRRVLNGQARNRLKDPSALNFVDPDDKVYVRELVRAINESPSPWTSSGRRLQLGKIKWCMQVCEWTYPALMLFMPICVLSLNYFWFVSGMAPQSELDLLCIFAGTFLALAVSCCQLLASCYAWLCPSNLSRGVFDKFHCNEQRKKFRTVRINRGCLELFNSAVTVKYKRIDLFRDADGPTINVQQPNVQQPNIN